jgi:hypothetical protein
MLQQQGNEDLLQLHLPMRTLAALVPAGLVCFSTQLRAQSETHYYDRWQVENSVSLTFTSGDPVVNLNDPLPLMIGGAALICHPITGAFQFGVGYTDANEPCLVDASGIVMPNSVGVFGTLIPKPSSATLYYVFTPTGTDFNQPMPYAYSMVDMSLRGGLGDVTSEKLLPLSGLFQGGTAPFGVASPDGLVHRVYLQRAGVDRLLNFRITYNDGLVLVPDSQTVPLAFPDNGSYGSVSVSISNDRLAYYDSDGSGTVGVRVASVDPETGLIGAPIFVLAPPFPPNEQLECFALSPLGTALYMGFNLPPDDPPLLYQYDLTTWQADSVAASLVIIPHPGGIYNGSPRMALAPDGRLYFGYLAGSTLTSHMSFVQYPDQYGPACEVHWYELPADELAEHELNMRSPPMWPRLGILSAGGDPQILEDLGSLYPSPNPAHDRVVLHIAGLVRSPTDVRIYDVMGKLALQQPWPLGATEQPVDISSLSPGHYEVSLLQRGAPSLHAHLLVQ